MKKFKALIFVTTSLIVFALLYLCVDLYLYAHNSANNNPSEKTIAVIPGQTFFTVSEKLHQAGIINNPIKFKLLVRLKRFDKKIKAGEYRLSSAMSPNKILDILVSGRAHLYKLTVPEGFNLFQIASLVEQAGFGTKEDFIKTATNPSFAKKKNLNAESFEGYLFPDTYYFPKGVKLEKIISVMVKRFWFVFQPKWKERTKQLEFSIHQIITLASIIEKETGATFERPIISSVFHNRLKRGMRLATDPTVIYGIKDFDGNIKKKHLKARTPYNTYVIKGLPPGPIANPGVKSIEAALYPDKTNYLYFVSKKDTTHKFSTNISAHNKAVRKYQLRR